MSWKGTKLTLMRDNSPGTLGFALIIAKKDALFRLADYLLVSSLIKKLVGKLLIFHEQLNIIFFLVLKVGLRI